MKCSHWTWFHIGTTLHIDTIDLKIYILCFTANLILECLEVWISVRISEIDWNTDLHRILIYTWWSPCLRCNCIVTSERLHDCLAPTNWNRFLYLISSLPNFLRMYCTGGMQNLDDVFHRILHVRFDYIVCTSTLVRFSPPPARST